MTSVGEPPCAGDGQSYTISSFGEVSFSEPLSGASVAGTSFAATMCTIFTEIATSLTPQISCANCSSFKILTICPPKLPQYAGF
uniref:Uncharacterized protein n=1 Tax=Arundo donax TaxID=35708 RepID=A0A0A9KBU1_ARUDO